MNGLSKHGDKVIKDEKHLKQSIEDILTTPVGLRVMNRRYGSKLFELIDQPNNTYTLAKILNATLDAIVNWENRVSVNQISVNHKNGHHIVLDIEFIYLINGNHINIKGIII